MDHSEVRDILEDAAIEPGGLERLMAGDTSNAALVASHVAGCPDCADELERLRRSVALIAPTVRDVPSPELRERTLAFVAAVGRPRGTAVAEPATAPAASRDPIPFPATPLGPPTRSVSPAPVAAVAGAAPIGPRRMNRLVPLLGLAAALIVAVTGTAIIASSSRDAELKLQAAEIEALGDVARATLHLDQQADVRRIPLAASAAGGGMAPSGQLTFSPGTTELVVVADGLMPAAAGQEYRCWVEANGTRRPIGKMFFGGSVAYWVGPVPAVGGIGNATFGVSLVDLANPGAPGQQVLAGAG